MSKRVKAIAAGFRKGERIKEGRIFFVGDNEKSKWFIDYPEDVKASPAKREPEAEKKDVQDLMM